MVIVGIIYFINSSGPQKNNSSETVTVVPRISEESSEIKREGTDLPPVRAGEAQAENKYLSLQEKAKKYELAKEITTPDGFINTDGKPIKISDYIGKKVILVDFWTYSCINCQRTTPYLNAWYKKYKDEGFVIVGMHTPEFEFEKNYHNVTLATKKEGIQYPVVLDNDYSTWTAYKNRYWPRKYLIDIDGYIVYDHIGEGGYEETERKIQEALAERMYVLGESGAVNQTLTKETPIQNSIISPETYFGASRNTFFGNGKPYLIGEQKGLSIPSQINLNNFYLSGDWNIIGEFIQNSSANASILYKYHAKDVFFVAEANDETDVEILSDGKPLEFNLGADVVKTSDGKTMVKIKEARLYKIIQGNETQTHMLEFKIQRSGLKAFTFTFG